MIINIRGTSGSGKSTIVRKIMDMYDMRMPFRKSGEKRKQPLGYYCTRKDGRGLAIIGHYESPCGGCDTISGYDRIFDQIRTAHRLGMDVFFEGLLISGDVKYTGALHSDGFPLFVIALEVSLEECLASVNARRRKKNPEAPNANPKNTTSKWSNVKSAMRRLAIAGVRTEWRDRDGATALVIQELDL